MHDDETSTELSPAQRLEQFGVRLDPQIDYCLERVFPKLQGWFARSDVRRRAAIIKQIEPLLRQLVKPNEQVLLVTKGVQSSFLEHYFLGIWAATINQTVFVLTNARILIFRTNSKGKPKETFWTLYYDQIAKVSASVFGGLSLKLKDRKSLAFSGVPKTDRQAMRQTVEEGVAHYESMGFHPQVSQSMETLCSYCLECVPKNEHRCASCGAEFWRPRDVALRSLIFPSWGDWVLKHHVVGTMELFGYAGSLLIAGVIFVSGIARRDFALAIGLPLLILGFVHGLDATVTYFVAQKGLHPRQPPTRTRRPAPADQTIETESDDEAEFDRTR